MPKLKTSAQILKSAQDEYNKFLDTIRPTLGLSEREQDKLGFAEIGRRIEDRAIRQAYVEYAISLLEANVAEYSSSSESIERQSGDSPLPVVGSLVGAALAYGFGGPISALLVAAIVYWSIHKHQTTRTFQSDAHNSDAEGWRETVDNWRTAIAELRGIET